MNASSFLLTSDSVRFYFGKLNLPTPWRWIALWWAVKELGRQWSLGNTKAGIALWCVNPLTQAGKKCLKCQKTYCITSLSRSLGASMKFLLTAEFYGYVTIQDLNTAQDSPQVLTKGSRRLYASEYKTQLLRLLQTRGISLGASPETHPFVSILHFVPSCIWNSIWLASYFRWHPGHPGKCFNISLRVQSVGLSNSEFEFRIWILNM